MSGRGGPWRLCIVTDRGLAHGRSLAEIVRQAIHGGASMVQLREKNATTRAFIDEARALKTLLASLEVPLIVNDRVDVALAIGADGVHVGQSDMPVAVVRALVGPNCLVGLSVTDADGIAAPDAALADYLGIGPVYAQTTKTDASMPLGPDGFRALRALTDKPVLAIGGLTPRNAGAVVAAGADGLAVVSGLMGAADPTAAARAYVGLYSDR